MTAKEKIVRALAESDRALALHEIPVMGINQAAASARLRELRREGLVESVPVPGKRFTAWKLTAGQGALPL